VSGAEVAEGFTYFGKMTLKAWGANRKRADWVQAFYGDELALAMIRFEESVLRAAQAA
jgi:hypothetical protein